MKSESSSIDSYIQTFPPATIKVLQEVRNHIRKLVPEAEEAMKYGIPTFVYHGNLVHFGGYKNHIGFYPGAEGIEQFKDEFTNYEWSKGAVQFPLTKPMPLKLITRIVKFRIEQNLAKATRKNRRVCPNGHTYIKTSDCPTCPKCEAAQKPTSGFMSTLSAPARRALENQGIKTIKQLSKYSTQQILELHGMGKASIPKLQQALKEAGLTFKK